MRPMPLEPAFAQQVRRLMRPAQPPTTMGKSPPFEILAHHYEEALHKAPTPLVYHLRPQFLSVFEGGPGSCRGLGEFISRAGGGSTASLFCVLLGECLLGGGQALHEQPPRDSERRGSVLAGVDNVATAARRRRRLVVARGGLPVWRLARSAAGRAPSGFVRCDE